MVRSEADCQKALDELTAIRVRLSEALGNWSLMEARMQDMTTEQLESACILFSNNALNAAKLSVESVRRELIAAYGRKVCYLQFISELIQVTPSIRILNVMRMANYASIEQKSQNSLSTRSITIYQRGFMFFVQTYGQLS